MKILVEPIIIFLLFGGQCYVRCDEHDNGDVNYEDYYDYDYDYCDVTASVEKDQECFIDDLKELEDLNATMKKNLCCPDGQDGFLHRYELCEVNLSLWNTHKHIWMEN